MKNYQLRCLDCTYTWESLTADFCECPNCQSEDIVVLGEIYE